MLALTDSDWLTLTDSDILSSSLILIEVDSDSERLSLTEALVDSLMLAEVLTLNDSD